MGTSFDESKILVIKSFGRHYELIAGFKVRLLEEAPRKLSPNRRIFVVTASLNSKIPQIIRLILSSHSFIDIGKK